MDAVTSGAIEFNKEEIANLTKTITNIRKNIYSDGEYEEIFLEPLLDDATFKNISDSVYKSLKSGGIEDAASLISSSFTCSCSYSNLDAFFLKSPLYCNSKSLHTIFLPAR